MEKRTDLNTEEGRENRPSSVYIGKSDVYCTAVWAFAFLSECFSAFSAEIDEAFVSVEDGDGEIGIGDEECVAKIIECGDTEDNVYHHADGC